MEKKDKEKILNQISFNDADVYKCYKDLKQREKYLVKQFVFSAIDITEIRVQNKYAVARHAYEHLDAKKNEIKRLFNKIKKISL